MQDARSQKLECTRQYMRISSTAQRRRHPPQHFLPYTENELPQPQVDVALGLEMTKRAPSRPSW